MAVSSTAFRSCIFGPVFVLVLICISDTVHHVHAAVTANDAAEATTSVSIIGRYTFIS